MDHTDIERRGLVDAYVTDRLDDDAVAAFEEHFLECRRCADAVATAERLRDGLGRVAADELEAMRAATVRAGLVVALARAIRRSAPLVVAASLVVAVGALAWSVQEGARADHLAADLTTVRSELDRALAPRTAGAVVALVPLRSATATHHLSVAEDEWLTLDVELPLADPADTYEVRFETSGGEVSWGVENVAADERGRLRLRVHSSSLPAGPAVLRVVDGHGTEIAVYPLRVGSAV